jgi:hypothetical protein
VDDGAVLLPGSFFGSAYLTGSEGRDVRFRPFCDDFERLRPPAEVPRPPAPRAGHVHIKWGRSGPHRLCFLVSDQGGTVTLRLDEAFFAGPVRDLVSGASIEASRGRGGASLEVAPGPWGVAVLTDAPRTP